MHRLTSDKGKGANCGRKYRRVLLVVVSAVATFVGCSNKGSSHSPSSSNTGDSTPFLPNAGSVTPQSADQSVPSPQEKPIDVNAMYGQPCMDAEEVALAGKVKEAIAFDPRIKSPRIYVGVTHNLNGNKRKYPVVTLAGSVASQEERTAAFNDVIKMKGEGWIVGNSLNIDASLAAQSAQNAQSGQPTDVLGQWSEPPTSERPSISLCPGLTIVTAIASAGDYESIKTVESVDSKQVRLRYSSESSQPWWEVPAARRNCEAGSPGCAITSFITHRTVLASDVESAHQYDQIFVTDKNAPTLLPGATAIGTSAAVLRELKTNGQSQLSMCTAAQDIARVEEHDNISNTTRFRPTPAGCEGFSTIDLKRVGNGPAHVRVIVDGAPVDLAAVQASGLHGPNKYSDRSEFFFLDDERNPLTLKFRLGIGVRPALDQDTKRKCELAKTQGNLILNGDDPPSCDLPEGGDRDVLTVMKITTRCEAPLARENSVPPNNPGSGASSLEKALSETGKIDIYSIYFSFNSDKLRDESKPTLTDIAEVMRRHPEWKLQVNGHTDGIGDDMFNLDLSQRRAAAVKDALVKQFKVGENRLTTAGYGKSQPKDTNETIEGRARNRRVELMRIS